MNLLPEVTDFTLFVQFLDDIHHEILTIRHILQAIRP